MIDVDLIDRVGNETVLDQGFASPVNEADVLQSALIPRGARHGRMATWTRVDAQMVAFGRASDDRANQRGLKNVRFVTGDANPWLQDRLVPDSVDEIHIYHPQPYYEVADISKRLLTPEYLERVWLVLRRGGLLVLQTDNKSYWSYLLQAAAKHFEPSVRPGPWPTPLGAGRAGRFWPVEGPGRVADGGEAAGHAPDGRDCPPGLQRQSPRFKKRGKR